MGKGGENGGENPTFEIWVQESTFLSGDGGRQQISQRRQAFGNLGLLQSFARSLRFVFFVFLLLTDTCLNHFFFLCSSEFKWWVVVFLVILFAGQDGGKRMGLNFDRIK